MVERVRMRTRENCQGDDPVGMLAGYAPRGAAAPVVADEMEAREPELRRDLHRVVDQPVEDIVVGVRRIGPRAGRIAALAWRYRAIAGVGQRHDLMIPMMEGFGKAVQQQNGRA